jgi:hypothetical protein
MFMANTLPDVVLQSGVYIDVYAATGISPGTSLVLNNKSAATVLVQVRASQPPSTSSDGWPLRAGAGEITWTTVQDVPTGSRVWVKGGNAGRLFVEVFEE